MKESQFTFSAFIWLIKESDGLIQFYSPDYDYLPNNVYTNAYIKPHLVGLYNQMTVISYRLLYRFINKLGQKHAVSAEKTPRPLHAP